VQPWAWKTAKTAAVFVTSSPKLWCSSETQLSDDRTQGTKCPFCEGRKVCEHNSLATKGPSQLKYWNQEKNAKTPEQMLAGSNLRAEWPAATGGKLKSRTVCRTTADVLFALSKLLERKQSNPRLKQRNCLSVTCCVSGTMSAVLQMAFIPTTPPLAATNSCIGIARSVLRDNCTGIKCVLVIVLAHDFKGVHIVLVIKCANATLWKLFTSWFHQSETLPEMT